MPYNPKGYDTAEASLKLLKDKFGDTRAYAMMTGYLIASVSEADAQRILEIVKEKVAKND
jgi:hypothetical protein